VKRITKVCMSLLAVAAVGGCATVPPSEDPVLARLEQIDSRLAAVERVLANGSLVDLTVQVDGLQRDAADLRGRTETIEHTADGATSRQRELYVDLDERIRSIEERMQAMLSGGNVLDGGSLVPGQLPVPMGTDLDNYQAAFELLKQQRYEPAAMAFQQFLISFPDSQRADNAQYWLAESYYVTDRFAEALSQFQVVVNSYPDSRKVSDALLKMGYCYYELERWNDATAALTRVQSEYPDTTAARLAEQRLNRMTEEGR
jgi:tol-pal system protein YbgF